jgi:hypothetical protein
MRHTVCLVVFIFASIHLSFAQTPAGGVFRRYDRNDDGKVTPDELPAKPSTEAGGTIHKHIQEPCNECRCDLDSRFSRDGRSVVIDAPRIGGRQLRPLDVGAIMG